MSVAVTCPSCQAALRVRDELAGVSVKCPHCGKGVAVPDPDKPPAKGADKPTSHPPRPRPAADKGSPSGARLAKPAERKPAAPAPEEPPAEEGADREDRPRKKHNKKGKQKQNKITLILAGIGGGAAVIAAVVILVMVLNKKDGSAKPPPRLLVNPQPQINQQAPPRNDGAAAVIDERQTVPARQEWSESVAATAASTIRFRVSASRTPFAVSVVTEHGFRTFQDGGEIPKEDFLLHHDCKEPQDTGVVNISPGFTFFIIRNQTDGPVEFHLECYGTTTK
jgi:predicted Zn finger-like uncharacterized protein